MAIPDFVVELRNRVGTLPLWLIGCTAVVVRPSGSGPEVLMVRRADNGAWTPVTGIVDPGEHPADAAIRETLEEAAVTASVDRLAQVGVTGEVTYPNGDRTQYLDLTFRCSFVAGDPYPADGENTEVRWVAAGSMAQLDPPPSTPVLARIAAALDEDPGTRLVTRESGGPTVMGKMEQ